MPTHDQPPTTNAVDFDAYLSLLTKLLRLTRGQQAEITAELRDHLDERLTELLSQGHPRESAIRLALEELGDAAVLAAEFTRPHQARRRRQLMRYSVLSGTAIVATFVMTALYWPAARPEPQHQVAAQARVAPDPADPQAQPAPAPASTPSAEDLSKARIEEKLASRDLELIFEDASLSEVVGFLSAALDIDILFDRRVLEEQGINPNESKVTLRVRKGALSAKTALEMILRQAVIDTADLTFAIRDEVLLITSPEADYANEVYDCRDLIAGVTVQTQPGQPGNVGGGFGGGGGGGQAGGVGGGFFQVPPEGATGGGSGTMPAGGGGSGGGGSGYCPGSATSYAGQALIDVIEQAIDQASWSNQGGTGTITEYDGLLIVHHSQQTQRKIEDLLAKMRKVRGAAAKAESIETRDILPRR